VAKGGIVVTHKDLNVWNEAIELVTDIYKMTRSFPKDEQYGLISQIRRAAVSIPSNIAEGSARSSRKEFIQFLNISMGSAVELETQVIISKNLGYITEELFQKISDKVNKISKMVQGLIKSIKSKNQEKSKQ